MKINIYHELTAYYKFLNWSVQWIVLRQLWLCGIIGMFYDFSLKVVALTFEWSAFKISWNTCLNTQAGWRKRKGLRHIYWSGSVESSTHCGCGNPANSLVCIIIHFVGCVMYSPYCQVEALFLIFSEWMLKSLCYITIESWKEKNNSSSRRALKYSL